jgi:hypothetical protein
MMSNWIYKILGGVITLVISLSLLPILQDAIDPLVTTGGIYEEGATGALLQMIPTILVVVFVLLAVTLIPKQSVK